MRDSTAATRLLGGAGLALVLALAGCLAGCMLDETRAAHAEGACVISGCGDEVCAGQSEYSPCIWQDAFVCFRDATCAPQSDGRCGWTPTSKLEACLAEHPPQYGAPAGSQP